MMNEAYCFVYGRKIEMSTFDYPWRELHDLSGGKCLLHDEAADDSVTYGESDSGLLHREPETLIRGRTSRKSPGVPNVLHALFRPSVGVACAIA